MLFNSFNFLGFFLALVIIYYLLPHRFRWMLLILASLYFYALFNTSYVLLLLGAGLVAYLIALAMAATQETSRKRLWLVIGVLASLAPLVVYKYFDFFAASLDGVLNQVFATSEPQQFSPRLGLLLPVGLSFFTFSCVSYIADVYSGKLPAERHVGHMLLYVSFFPKLLAGPIERATTFLPQLLKPIQFSGENVTAGLQLMLWGLFKKVVIADRLAVFVDAAYKTPATTSPVDLLIATYFFAFQIYCDFSGYTDIAIGAAKVLGIDLMLNFRRPYLSTSVVEFWGKNRWHISLSRWFRDYMFIPMGGGRVSVPRHMFNLLAVFVVSGLWHGANWTFVIWGALNGIYQVIATLLKGAGDRVGKFMHLPLPVASFLSAVLTFHLILVTWVFFRAASLQDAVTVFTRIANSLANMPSLVTARAYGTEIYLSVGLILVLLGVEILDEHRAIWQNLRVRPTYVRWAVYYALLLALLIFGSWQMRQFIYMQF